MSFWAMGVVMQHRAAWGLDARELSVHLSLAYRLSDETAQCNPSVTTIAADTGLPRKRVLQALASLAAKRVIEISGSGERSGRRANQYRLRSLSSVATAGSGADATPLNDQTSARSGSAVAPLDGHATDSSGVSVAPLDGRAVSSSGVDLVRSGVDLVRSGVAGGPDLDQRSKRSKAPGVATFAQACVLAREVIDGCNQRRISDEGEKKARLLSLAATRGFDLQPDIAVEALSAVERSISRARDRVLAQIRQRTGTDG